MPWWAPLIYVGYRFIKYLDYSSKLNSNPLRIFISYSSENRVAVRSLCERLKSQDGLNPWLDEQEINPGSVWDVEIHRAIRKAHVAIICLTPQSNKNRGYFRKEISVLLEIAQTKPNKVRG